MLLVRRYVDRSLSALADSWMQKAVRAARLSDYMQASAWEGARDDLDALQQRMDSVLTEIDAATLERQLLELLRAPKGPKTIRAEHGRRHRGTWRDFPQDAAPLCD